MTAPKHGSQASTMALALYRDDSYVVADANGKPMLAVALLSYLRDVAAERDAALSTVQRLRGALECVAGKDWSSLCADHAAEEMRDVARAALAATQPEGGAK